ncbi:MAG: hypothetical protein A4E38_00287 [Methanoregulaceae archaeon PtaB.Bin108]|nr:MAG: hypothetical protein A4E38_00287 [Methanoregulaceae archaeon PtaB.Bin108]
MNLYQGVRGTILSLRIPGMLQAKSAVVGRCQKDIGRIHGSAGGNRDPLPPEYSMKKKKRKLISGTPLNRSVESL